MTVWGLRCAQQNPPFLPTSGTGTAGSRKEIIYITCPARVSTKHATSPCGGCFVNYECFTRAFREVGFFFPAHARRLLRFDLNFITWPRNDNQSPCSGAITVFNAGNRTARCYRLGIRKRAAIRCETGVFSFRRVLHRDFFAAPTVSGRKVKVPETGRAACRRGRP